MQRSLKSNPDETDSKLLESLLLVFVASSTGWCCFGDPPVALCPQHYDTVMMKDQQQQHYYHHHGHDHHHDRHHFTTNHTSPAGRHRQNGGGGGWPVSSEDDANSESLTPYYKTLQHDDVESGGDHHDHGGGAKQEETDRPCPPGFTHFSGKSLIIERRWLHMYSPWLIVVVFVVAWGIWLHQYTSSHSTSRPYQTRNNNSSYELIISIVFFPLTLYLFLAVVFNITTIIALPNRIYVQTRPFPLGSSTLKLENLPTIRRVFWTANHYADPDHAGTNPRTNYKVSCETISTSTSSKALGNIITTHDILVRVSDQSHAEYVATLLDDFYRSIRDDEEQQDQEQQQRQYNTNMMHRRL